jgi:hypothetical protein
MERTVGSLANAVLLDDLAVRELAVCHPDGYLRRRGSGLAVGLVLPSGPAKEAEHGDYLRFLSAKTVAG